MCEVSNQKPSVQDFFEIAKSSIPKWLKNSVENLSIADSWDDLSPFEDEGFNDKVTKACLEDYGIKRESSDEENIAISSSKSDCSSEDSALNKVSFPIFKDIYESECSVKRNETFNETIGNVYNNTRYEEVLDGLCKYTKILLEENNYFVPEIKESREKISYYHEKVGQISKLDDSFISVSLEQRYNRFIADDQITEIPEYKIVKNLNSTHILVKKDTLEKAFQFEIFERNSKRAYYLIKKNYEKTCTEKETLSNFKHPNIVEFFCSYRKYFITYIITEYLPCGDFISLIRFKEKNKEVSVFYYKKIIVFNFIHYIR